MIAILVSAAVVMVLFGIFRFSLPVTMMIAFVIGFLQMGGFNGIYPLGTQLYPAEVRSTGIGWMTGVGRAGAVLGPLVGGIMIATIQLISVTERTKEIGIRKSLGARQADILKQFLVESALLSAIGGLIGLILAILIGVGITAFVFPTRIPWWSAVIAIGISAAVGILAGLFPAWKAAKLDPIEALRAD